MRSPTVNMGVVSDAVLGGVHRRDGAEDARPDVIVPIHRSDFWLRMNLS
jgi:hypothetical protein